MAADDEKDYTIKSKAGPGLGTLLLVSLLSSVLVSAAVGGGLYFLIKPALDAAQPAGEESDGTAKDRPKGPPRYFSMDDPFIVNLSAQPGRFLQVTVELMTRDEDVEQALGQHRPLMRNNLLLLFSSATAESIATAEGKEALRREALDEVRAVLEGLGEPSAVEDLYFTSLVVQ